MLKCDDRKDFLFTQEPSGNLLLGDKTKEEIEKEEKYYQENNLNEEI